MFFKFCIILFFSQIISLIYGRKFNKDIAKEKLKKRREAILGVSNSADLIALGDGCNSGQSSCDSYTQYCLNAETSSNYCYDCPPYMYCDGIYAYKITATNDVTNKPERYVIPSVNIYNIYYGDFSGTTGTNMKSLLDDFVKNLGKSDYYKTMSGYYQNNAGVKTFVSNSVKLGASISVATTTKGTTIQESDIISTINNLIATNKLPLDPNGLYSIVFRGDIIFKGPFAPPDNSWPNWCGYHSDYIYSDGKTKIKISIAGDPTTAKPMATGCMMLLNNSPNNNLPADNIVGTIAHEIFEVVSNFDGAWYWRTPGSYHSGEENADLCSYFYGYDSKANYNVVVGTKKWYTQANWIPKYGCAFTLPTTTITSSILPTIKKITTLPTNSPSLKTTTKPSSLTPKARPSTTPSIAPKPLPTISSTFAPKYKPSLSPSIRPTKSPPSSTPSLNPKSKQPSTTTSFAPKK